MKAMAASRLTFSFLLPGAVHSKHECYPASVWKALAALITMQLCAFKDYKATMQRIVKFILNISMRIKQSSSICCFKLGRLFIFFSEICITVNKYNISRDLYIHTYI